MSNYNLNSYKYNPRDFIGMPSLLEDLSGFYEMLEIYRKDKNSTTDWLNFRRQWENVFFSIKHREVEGCLDTATAQEIRDYLEELAND